MADWKNGAQDRRTGSLNAYDPAVSSAPCAIAGLINLSSDVGRTCVSLDPNTYGNDSSLGISHINCSDPAMDHQTALPAILSSSIALSLEIAQNSLPWPSPSCHNDPFNSIDPLGLDPEAIRVALEWFHVSKPLIPPVLVAILSNPVGQVGTVTVLSPVTGYMAGKAWVAPALLNHDKRENLAGLWMRVGSAPFNDEVGGKHDYSYAYSPELSPQYQEGYPVPQSTSVKDSTLVTLPSVGECPKITITLPAPSQPVVTGTPATAPTKPAMEGFPAGAGAPNIVVMSDASQRRTQQPGDVTVETESTARREAMRRKGAQVSQPNNFIRQNVRGNNPNLQGPNGEPSEALQTKDLHGNDVRIEHHKWGHEFADDNTYELPHYHGPNGEHISYERR